MTVTIGLVANIYQEANALPGWLECHTPYFDDIRVLHAGPGGSLSNDGTLEILEKWRIPVSYCCIDEGFGAVRTRAIQMSSCDYVMILDADERFHHITRVLSCDGYATPQEEVDRILSTYHFRNGNEPDWGLIASLGADLRVQAGTTYDQGNMLRRILEERAPDANHQRAPPLAQLAHAGANAELVRMP